MKLTKVQREILQLLTDGEMISIDQYNMAYVGGRGLASRTRYFLTEKKLVWRKNITKRLDAEGNGFVISDRGRAVLAGNPPPIRRGPNQQRLKEKRCPDCGFTKSVEEFVTVYGYANPRGKYCMRCFAKHQREHAASLMGGRSSCLYCGKEVDQAYDWTPKGGSKRTYLHLDHMDPLALGGDDDDSNTIYCCVECNLSKGKMLFCDWLERLSVNCREEARRLYIKMHDRKPEDFVAGAPSPRGVFAMDRSDLY